MLASTTIVVGIACSATGGRAALALARDGIVFAAKECGVGRRASEDLLPTLSELLEDANLEPSASKGAIVLTGPGSFTGIRVGLATAFGLRRALDLDIRGISTLACQAGAAAFKSGEKTRWLSLMSAGRSALYAGVYRVDGRAFEAEWPSVRLLQQEDLPDAIALADAAIVVEQGSNAIFGVDLTCTSSALECAQYAARSGSWLLECPEERFPAEPLYVRRSWAEEVALSNGQQ